MMQYRTQIVQNLEDYMHNNLIDHTRLKFENTQFYPLSFKDYAFKKHTEFVSVAMDSTATARKIDRWFKVFLESHQPNRPLLLILFFNHKTENQHIYKINHAYDMYRLIKNTLLSDWAIASMNGQDIIFCDEEKRQYLFVKKTYQDHRIHIQFNRPFPPHKTVN
ncbi:MAG: hypothetical protein ACK5LE_06695 [Alphaproteobacteria bacterium]